MDVERSSQYRSYGLDSKHAAGRPGQWIEARSSGFGSGQLPVYVQENIDIQYWQPLLYEEIEIYDRNREHHDDEQHTALCMQTMCAAVEKDLLFCSTLLQYPGTRNSGVHVFEEQQ